MQVFKAQCQSVVSTVLYKLHGQIISYTALQAIGFINIRKNISK